MSAFKNANVSIRMDQIIIPYTNKRYLSCGVILLSCFLFFSSCASYQLDKAQGNLRNSFAVRDFDRTVELLEKYKRKDVYRSKEEVLYNLELGMAKHFSSEYDSSSVHFTKAEEEMDRLYTKSISRGLASFLLTNDNSLAYDGEAYEDIYLNAFKSLNFIHQENYDAALVEARRMAFKLSQLEIKYKGIAEALSKADTLEQTEWKTGKSNIQNSAFSHYLSAILYAKSGKPDDARIEYEKMLQAFNDQPDIYSFEQPDRESMQRIKNPGDYNVLITGFAGRAPIKKQNDVRLYLDDKDLYLKFSLPSLHLYQSQVQSVEVIFDDTLAAPLYLMEEMDVVAKEMYKIKEPIIYARAFARSFVKAIGTNVISKEIEEENEGLGKILNIFGKIGQEFSEKADLRSWQTMPGKAYANVVGLPPGDHQAEIRYYDSRGRLLFTQQKFFSISSYNDLELIETLYWN